MQQRTSHIRGSFLIPRDNLSPPCASRTSPGLARVRMELARPGRLGADFDSRSSKAPYGDEPGRVIR